MKEESTADLAPTALTITVNGLAHALTDVDPRTRLADWLRSPTVGLTGTKLVCGEGGCGACTVLVTRLDAVTGATVRRQVNSCLHLVGQMDGVEVTTVEGIGSTRSVVGAVQERIAAMNGTQCGFCTPGFVMSMSGLLAQTPSPTVQQVEDHFDGNLCRCTGYRPILDAMQTFAVEVNPATAAGGGAAVLSRLPPPSPRARPAAVIADTGWLRPSSLVELRQMMYAAGATAAGTQLVNGNTSAGIYQPSYRTSLLIDISDLDELRVLAHDEASMTVGGGVTLNELVDYIDVVVGSEPGERMQGLLALRAHLEMVANVGVRNVATVAGNLMIARNHVETGSPFPSDVLTVLATLGASITIVFAAPDASPTSVPIAELPSFDEQLGGYVVVAVVIPFADPSVHVRTFKVARRVQNSHALVNAGFAIGLSPEGVVQSATICLGGIGRWVVHSTSTMRWLLGRPWTLGQLDDAVALLREDVVAALAAMPECGVPDEYRINLASGLLVKAFVAILLEVDPSAVPPPLASAGKPYVRPISSGCESLVDDPAEYPVGAPMVSLSAPIEATGEAIYTQDIDYPGATLHAAYVYAGRPHATFDFSPLGGLTALLTAVKALHPTVCDIVTVADVPEPDRNMMGLGGDDPVFAPGVVTAVGQPIALVLDASSAVIARAAAEWVMDNGIAYVDQQPVAFTIEEALALPPAQGLFADDPKRYLEHIAAITRPGSDATWLADPQPEPGMGFVTGQQHTGQQAHFYMETQTALVIPGETDQYLVHSSSQDLASVQHAVAAVLGVSNADVVVRALRIGGGYGGKETRPPMFAAAAAVAAVKWDRPVRLAVDRNSDMTMMGTRHPYRGNYMVSFAHDGTIAKWKHDFYANGGSTYDVTFPVSDLVLLSADGAYFVPTFEATATCCRTNQASNTAMRSFGVIQCSLVVEDAVEQVAHALGKLPEDVRAINMYADAEATATQTTPYGQPLKYAIGRAVWERLRTDADFDARAATVASYNQQNLWRKRGISMIPIKYGISYTFISGNQGGALVTVSEADGSVVLATGGIEMGQGLTTKLVQIAAFSLGIPMSLIRSAATITEVVPNASSTGGSTGADLNGGAVKMACEALRSRLVAFCRANETQPGFPDWKNDWVGSWATIVQLAYSARQDLSAQALFASPDLTEVSNQQPLASPFYYFSYSAACSEVEIDVLTGESVVLRSDILYDAGQSLNPLLDVGQVRGGFVQGLGNVTGEYMYYDDAGRPYSDGTWNYKIPCSKSIPVDLRVGVVDYTRIDPHTDVPIDPYGIQSSKSTGEPPLVLANTIFFAIKHAVLAARADRGETGWFELESPATVDRIQLACLGE